MTDRTPHGPADQAAKASWAELFQGAYALYTVMVMLGVVLFSVQVLVIVTIMPTVVTDIGGASYYVWASMLYQVGAIVGAASVGPIWKATDARRVFLIAATVYTVGTLGCAIAPDMLALNLARTVQGFGGGLITGGTMGIVSRLFRPNQRTRVLAMYQGTWTICSLLGPFFGGAFAEFGWWRGSFWAFLPFIAAFAALVWWKLPKDLKQSSGAREDRAGFPFLRIALLTAGVLGIAQAGQLRNLAWVAVLLVTSVFLIWFTFRIDGRETRRLFPSKPFSIRRPVGLGYWILIIGGGVQGPITIFLPLALQIVHDVTPLWVGVTNLVISLAWTISTFLVSGWSGARERFAIISGPVFMLAAVVALAANAIDGTLFMLLLAAFVFGWGIGIHNVHLGARTMGAAEKGEEGITASSLSMVRSLGGAIGTAGAGMVANLAGLGDSIDPATVNHVVFAVDVVSALPLVFAILFAIRLARLVVPLTPTREPARAAGE
jgi:MFS family permease